MANERGKGRARVPDGTRIYAVGDVHGRADLLDQTFLRIDADLAKWQGPSVHVFLGDYIDRGPHSRDVLELLIARSLKHEAIFLKGNHETYVFEFLKDPSILNEWREFGGLETLMSYGLMPSLKPDAAEHRELAAALKAVLPASHRRFFGRLALSFACGDFFFVHAGVRPGIPLSLQRQLDLLWIRDEFLLHEDSFGKVVVHGHTPVREPDFRPNRINIDTGAYVTGRLTCVVFEKNSIEVI